MKPIDYRKCLLTAILPALLIADLSAQAQAQPSPDRPIRRRGAGDAANTPGLGARSMPGLERLQSILTEEQRASLREIIAGQREKMSSLEQQMRDARREIFQAGLAEKFDEEAVRQKAAKAAKLDAEITVLRAKAFSQIRPRLTPEQIEKLQSGPMMGREDGVRERPNRPDTGARDEHDLPVKQKPAPAPNP